MTKKKSTAKKAEQKELDPWCEKCDNCGRACVPCKPVKDGKPTRYFPVMQ